MAESNEPMASPAVSGLKLTFIMTGLCLAVLLTGMVRKLFIYQKQTDSGLGPNYPRYGCAHHQRRV
jgi:hypothetical protein